MNTCFLSLHMCSRTCKHNYRITIIVKIGYHDHSPARLVVTGVPLARDDMHSPRATVKHTPCRLKRRTSSRQPTPVQGRITASNSNTSRLIVIHIADDIGTLFFPATTSSWNNLPFGIEKVDSVECFKLKLKEHTFSRSETLA